MRHDLDEAGEPIHIDIDPFIPTGTCSICADVPQETQAPEDRTTADPPQPAPDAG